MFELSVFLFALLLMLFLGSIIFAHDTKNLAHKLFFLWILFAGAWMATNFLENLGSLSLLTREYMLRADFASSIIGCSFLLLFAITFSGHKLNFYKYFGILFPGLIMATFSFSPFVLDGVAVSSSNAITYVPGLLYEVYGLVMLGNVIGAAFVLAIAMRGATDQHKKQMQVILLSFLTTLLITIPINFFLQNVLPYQASRIGIYAFLIFVGGTAYTIVKHEFLRIRFILIEFFLLGLLAMLLSRLILSISTIDFVINLISVLTLLVLGFFLIRSVVAEIAQRLELTNLTVKLKAANNRLKQLDTAKSEFLSIASHQLRTPLSSMRGYTDLLLDGTYGKVTSSQFEVVTKLHASIQTLIDLVNQLLNVSSIESGKTLGAVQKVDLTKICTDVANFLSIKATERGLKLTCDQLATAPVLADPGRVKEVMMNLVENALKYTDKGSVQVKFAEELKYVRVDIQDTGIGLDKSSINKLFQKFSRVESSTLNHTGTGLGLYVCKRLVEAMGGEIWVSSPGVGQGSSFSFRLKKATK